MRSDLRSESDVSFKWVNLSLKQKSRTEALKCIHGRVFVNACIARCLLLLFRQCLFM